MIKKRHITNRLTEAKTFEKFVEDKKTYTATVIKLFKGVAEENHEHINVDGSLNTDVERNSTEKQEIQINYDGPNFLNNTDVNLIMGLDIEVFVTNDYQGYEEETNSHYSNDTYEISDVKLYDGDVDEYVDFNMTEEVVELLNDFVEGQLGM